MTEKLRKKLNSEKGESLSEVLVALLVVVLAGVMLAAMIGASSKIILKSKNTFETYYNGLNDMQKKSEAESATAVLSSGSDKISSIHLDLYSAPAFGSTDAQIRMYEKSAAAGTASDDSD